MEKFGTLICTLIVAIWFCHSIRSNWRRLVRPSVQVRALVTRYDEGAVICSFEYENRVITIIAGGFLWKWPKPGQKVNLNFPQGHPQMASFPGWKWHALWFAIATVMLCGFIGKLLN